MRPAPFSSRLPTKLVNVALILGLLGAVVLSAWVLFIILFSGVWITSLLLTLIVAVALTVFVGGLGVLLELLVVRGLKK